MDSGLILPWDRQPDDGSLELDWGNPLTRGLVFAVVGSAPFIDLVRGRRASETGDVARAVGKDGPMARFGSGQYLDYAALTADEIGNGTPATVAWSQQPMSPSGYHAVANISVPGGSSNFLIYQAVSDSGYYFVAGRRGSSTISWSSGVGASADGLHDRFILRTSEGLAHSSPSASNWTLRRNHSRVPSPTTAATSGDTSSGIRLGARETGTDPFEGGIGYFVIWARYLSDDEEAEFNARPWRLFKPRRIPWAPVSAGGGAYTLTAAQGSYSLTGQAVALATARRLTAAQGSYTLTGQSVALTFGRRLTAAQGGYALTGRSVNLLRGATLAAAQGAYVLSGHAVGLLASRRLAAAQGVYVLSGQDVTLTYSQPGTYTLTAAFGSYVLTGHAAGLLATRRLVAAAGSYSLAGQAVGLKRAYSVVAAHGVYALSGQPAQFARGYLLSAAGGIYTLTGADVAMTVSVGTPILSAAPIGSRLNDATRTARTSTGARTSRLSTRTR